MEQELTWKSILHHTQSEVLEGRCCLETDGHADCGKTIADFEIVRKVIYEGRIQVYKVKNDEQEIFAAKVCNKKSENEPFQQNELQILKKLQGLKNENIVRFEHLFEIGDWRILVLEWLDLSLYDVLVIGNELEIEMTEVLISKLVKVLKFLHTQNIAYLDLKSQNVMFNKDGIVKLIDFDLSYQFGNDDPQYFVPGGTIEYAAPEITIKKFDKRSDWYCLGNLAVQCISLKTLNELFFDRIKAKTKIDRINVLSEINPDQELDYEGEISHPFYYFIKNCLKFKIEERIDLDKTEDDLRDVKFLKDIGPTEEEKFIHLMKEYVEAKLANGRGSYLLQY